jgi:hypothetical protein
MAKLITLGAAVSATSATAQTAQSTTTTPFAPGFNAIAHLHFTGLTGTPTVKIQTSEDNSNWTDALTVSVLTRSSVLAEITLQKYARLNVTAVGDAGTIDAYLQA